MPCNPGSPRGARSRSAASREDRRLAASLRRSSNPPTAAPGNARTARPYARRRRRARRPGAAYRRDGLFGLRSACPSAFEGSSNPRLLLQPVTRRRLGAVGAVQTQASPKLGVLSFERFYPAHQRADEVFDFGWNNHPPLSQKSTPLSRTKHKTQNNHARMWHSGLTPAWQLLRADKTDHSFEAIIHLAAAVINSR